MADQVEIQLPRTRVRESAAFPLTAYFRTRATSAASIPTTVDYKVSCLNTGNTLTDWTTLTPAANVSITITAVDNAIQSASNTHETRQIIVRADKGLASQAIGSASWKVENLLGIG